MSRENVELVRVFLTAFAGGDKDGWGACLSDDVVLVEAREFPGAGLRHGRDAAVEAVADWGLAWAEMSFDVEEFEEAGDRVLAAGRMRMRGAGTGMQFENPAALLCSVRDGAITRVELFLDVDEARRRAA